jgi:D-aminopeptidase
MRILRNEPLFATDSEFTRGRILSVCRLAGYNAAMSSHLNPEPRPRARALGLAPGVLPPGPLNAISDVAGVRVGHVTLWEGDDIRTGVTAILPHGGNLFQEKIPAGLAVGNGFGKLAGATQIAELGEIETPVVLTNTLAVPRAAAALLDWTLAQAGNEAVVSVNPVVGETNDSWLNDIRRRVVTTEHVLAAIAHAAAGPVAEGCVGAGTGTVAFGWKGGIGTSSRRLPPGLGGYTVGVLVQSNFGGILQIAGIPVGQLLDRYYLKDQLGDNSTSISMSDSAARTTHYALRNTQHADGSIMLILATDAPLSDRNLTRLARRAFAGLARTGAAMSNGSGDYALAFSTAEAVRRTPERRKALAMLPDLPNDLISPLFLAAIEATEEAIYNSLLCAITVTGYRGRTVEALPLTGWLPPDP